MADIKTIEGVDVAGKRVLVRVDFNEIGRASCRERVSSPV